MEQSGIPHTIIGPDGTIVVLDGSGELDTPYRVHNVVGLASAEQRGSVADLPEEDGAEYGDFFLGRRSVIYDGTINPGLEPAARNAAIANLSRATRALRGELEVRFQPDGFPPLFYKAKREQRLRVVGAIPKEFQLALVARDPRLYSQALHSASSPVNKIASNSGFEAGDFTGWANSVGGAGTRAVASDAEPLEGDFFARGTAGGAADHAVIRHLTMIPVDVTKPYVLTAYLRKESGGVSPKTSIRLWCYDEHFVFLGHVFPNEAVAGVGHAPTGFFDPGAGEWSRWGGRYRGVAGVVGTSTGGFLAGTHYVQVEIYLTWTPAGAVAVLLDAVQLEQAEEASTYTGNDVAGAAFPLEFPIDFGGGSGAHAAVGVLNEGNHSTPGRFRVRGYVRDPLLRLASTGETLYVDGLEVQTNEWLDVDFGGRTVVKSDGTSYYAKVRRPGSRWWQIPPGAHTVQLFGLAAGLGVGIDAEWRSAWE